MRITQPAARTIGAVMTAVVAFTVAGCGGSDEPSAPAAARDQAAVETVFRSYHQALLARDFATACALNAPDTNAALVRNVNAQGGRTTTCEEALTTLYAGPGAAAVADRVSTSAQIQQVTVGGNTATLAWTFDNQGRPETVNTGLRLIDGQWRLLAVGT